MSIEAMKQALEFLRSGNFVYPTKIATDLEQAIAEAEKQEPVANYCKECLTYNGHQEACSHYTTPPQRTWVGLDNDDLIWIYSNSDKVGQAISNTEAKLKEKNT